MSKLFILQNKKASYVFIPNEKTGMVDVSEVFNTGKLGFQGKIKSQDAKQRVDRILNEGGWRA